MRYSSFISVLAVQSLLALSLTACGSEDDSSLVDEVSGSDAAIVNGNPAQYGRVVRQGAVFFPVPTSVRQIMANAAPGQARPPFVYACGAVYLGVKNARHWALTAADCVIGQTEAFLGFGKANLTSYSPDNVVKSRRIMIHPNYQPGPQSGSSGTASARSNLALIELQARPPNATAVQLPGRQGVGNPGANTRVIIAGWGERRVVESQCQLGPGAQGMSRMAHGVPVRERLNREAERQLQNTECIYVVTGAANRLTEAETRVFNGNQCQETFPNVDVTNICVQDDSAQPEVACRGDIGGPMYRSDTMQMVGIAGSTATGCDPEAPQVYTRVQAHRDWLRAQTGL